MNRKAFTLAEILVSISIIIILASLSFAVMRQALNRAKATVCISNLKQIHAAMSMYQSDYDSYPPHNVDWPGLRPFFGFVKLQCPVAPPDEPDYFIHASFESGSNPLDAPCMEKRGPEYPIAHDFNHQLTRSAYQTRERFILFVRLDGSVGRTQNRSLFELTQSEPCPGASYWSNL